MNRVVTPENNTQLHRRQRCHGRKVPAAEACTLRQTAVGGLHQQPRPPGLKPFARRLPARNGLSRPPGQAQKVADATAKTVLDPRAKVGGKRHLPTRGPHEGPAAQGGF